MDYEWIVEVRVVLRGNVKFCVSAPVHSELAYLSREDIDKFDEAVDGYILDRLDQLDVDELEIVDACPPAPDAGGAL